MPEDKERCPDCDAVDPWAPYSDKGNGECSSCHGTGKDIGADIGNALNPIYQTDNACPECRGSKVCRTCRGEGYS